MIPAYAPAVQRSVRSEHERPDVTTHEREKTGQGRTLQATRGSEYNVAIRRGNAAAIADYRRLRRTTVP